MAVSDELGRLSMRAKEAEDRTTAARSQVKADLATTVKSAHKSAQEAADKLKAAADADKARIASGWGDVQVAWSAHLAKVHEKAEDRREKHDLKKAQRVAEDAEAEAMDAIGYAYAAIEEAESAALDAILARRDADELGSRSAG